MKSNSLNHVYRVVWNAALQLWQVVSEVTKGKGKTKSARSASMTTLAQLVSSGALLLGVGLSHAELPQGGQVTAGSGRIESSGSDMVVRQNSDRMAVDWESFNIGSGNKVEFKQPLSTSVALNRVLGGNPSQIRGSLIANGRVFLVNPSGIVFGEKSVVDVAGIVASTLNISNENFMAGQFKFEGTSNNAIVNQGTVSAKSGGFVVLIAAKMENVGRLTAQNGDVVLAAGQRVRLDLGGPVKIEVDGPVFNAYIKNGGIIKADGGRVMLTVEAADQLASLAINNTGIIQAQGIGTGDGGTIRLSGGQGTVQNSGTLDVSSAEGKGGQIDIAAANIQLAPGSVLSASGALGGGLVNLQADRTFAADRALLDAAQRANAINAAGLGGEIRVAAPTVTINDSDLNASADGTGGAIDITGADQTVANARLDTSGAQMGGRIRLNDSAPLPEAPHQPQPQAPAPAPTTLVVSNSALRSNSKDGEGGDISLTADELDLLDDNILSADGATGGGNIKIGGGFQGQDISITNAWRTFVGAGTQITANALHEGKGGEVIVWADNLTEFEGQILAQGGAVGGDGGFAEVSGKATLVFAGTVDLTASRGQTGTLLLDPFNLTISSSSSTAMSGYDAAGTGSILNVGTLQTALNTAHVTVTTGSSGEEAGNITIADSISWGSDYTLTLTAAGSVTLATGKTISSFDGGLTINAGTGISQEASSRMRIGGATSLNTTTGNIVLDSALNVFSGTVAATAGSGNITLVNSQELKLGNVSAGGTGVVSLSTASGSNASIVSSGTFSAVSLNASTDGGGSIVIADVNGPLTITSLVAQGNITIGDTNSGVLTLAGNGNATDGTSVIQGNARFGIYGSGTVTLRGSSIVINDDIRTEGGNVVMVSSSGSITSGADADIVTSSLDGTGTTSGRVDLTAANGMTLNNVTTSGSGNLFGVGANAADVYLTALDGAIQVANISASGGSAINSYDPTPNLPDNGDTVVSPPGTPPNRNGGNAGVVILNAVGNGVGGDFIFLNGDIATAGGSAVGTSETGLGGYVNVKSALKVTGDRTITTGSTVGDVEFDSTLDSNGDASSHGLTITTGEGNVSMHGAIGGIAALDFLRIEANAYIELDENVTLNNGDTGNAKEGLYLSASSVLLGDPTDAGTITIDTLQGNGSVDINANTTTLREDAIFTRGTGKIDFSRDLLSQGSEQNDLTFNGAAGGVVQVGQHFGANGRLGDVLFETGTDILIPGQMLAGSFIALNNTGLIRIAESRSGLGAYQDYNRIGGLQIATTGTANVSANDHNIQIYSNINLSFADAPLSVTATNGALGVSYSGSSNRITIDTQGGDATFTANTQLNFLHADMNTRGGDVSLTGNGVYQYGDYWEGSSDINAGAGKIRIDGNGGVITLLGTFTTTDSDTNGTKAVIVQDASTVNINTITAQTGTLRVGEMVGDPLVANVTGNINQSSPSNITGKIDIKTLEAFAGGNIAITSTANVIDTLGNFSLGGSLSVSAIGRAAGMELTGNITATSVDIRTGADVPFDGTLKLNTYNITSTTGDIWLQGAGISQAAGATINSAGKVTIYGNDYRLVRYWYTPMADWSGSYKNADLAGQIIAASTANDAVTFANINGLVLPNMQIGSAGTRGGLRIGVDNWNHIKGAVTQSADAGKELLVSQVSGYTNNIITLDNALNEIDSLGDFQRGGHLTIVDSAGGLNFNGSSWYHFENNGNSTSNVTITTPGLMALGGHDIRGAAVTLTAGAGLASTASAITSSSGSYISGGGGTGDVVLDANGSNIVLAGQLDQSNHNNQYWYQDYPGVWGVTMIADGKIIIKDANTVTLANVYANRDSGELVLGQSDAAITGAVITNGEVDVFKLSGYIEGETASLTMIGEFIRQIGDLTAKNGVSITNNQTGLAVAGAIVADNTNAGITLTTTTSGLVANRYFNGYGALPTNTRLSSIVGSSMAAGLGGVAMVSDQDIALNGTLTTTGGVTLRATRVYDPANTSTFRGIVLNGNLTAGANGLGLHSGEGVQQNGGVIVTTGAVYGMNAAGQTTQNASNLAARKQISLGMDNEIAQLGAFYLGKYDTDPNPGGDFVVKDVQGGLVLTGHIVNQFEDINIATAGAALDLATYSLTAGNQDLYGKNISLTGRGITQDITTPGALNVNGTTVNRGGTIELVGHDGTTELVDAVEVLAAAGAGDILFYGTLTTKNDSSSAIVIRGAKDVVLPNVEILHGDVIKGQLSLGTGTALDEIISGNVSQGAGTSIQVADLLVSAGGSVVLTNADNSIEELVGGLAGDVQDTVYDMDLFDKTGGLRIAGDVVSAGGIRIKTYVEPAEEDDATLSLAGSDIKADGDVFLQGKGITQTVAGVITANNTVQTPDTEGGTITLDGGGSILSLLGEVSTNSTSVSAVVMQNASTVTLNTVNVAQGTLILGGSLEAEAISESVTQTATSVVSAKTVQANVGVLTLNKNNLIDQLGTITATGTLTITDAGGDAGATGLVFVGNVSAGGVTSIKSTDGSIRLGDFDLTVGTTENSTFTGAALTLEGVGIAQTYNSTFEDETESPSDSAITAGATTLKGGAGSILLGSSANDFGAQVTPTATGDLVFIRDVNDMTLASLASISNAAPNNTSITAIAGKALSLNTGALTTAAGSVDLRSLDGDLATPGSITTGSGNVNLFASQTLALNNSVNSTSGNLSVTGRTITHNSGTLSLKTGGAGTVDVNATGLDGLAMATGYKYESDTGTITIQSAGVTDLANVISNGRLLVRSSGEVTQNAANTSLQVDSLEVVATNNANITLDNINNNFASVKATSRDALDEGAGSGEIRLKDKQDGLSVEGISTTSIAVVTVTAGDVSQSDAIDVGGLALKGAGNFTLTHAGNKLPIVASEATGNVNLTSSVDTSIGVVNPTGVTTGGANFVLTSSAITVGQSINTGVGMLSLTATNGGITQADGSADLTAGSVKLTATGNISLLDTDNDFGTLAASVTGASASIDLQEDDGFTVGTVDGLSGITSNAGDVDIASAAIRLNVSSADGEVIQTGAAGGHVILDGEVTVLAEALIDSGTGDVVFMHAINSHADGFGLTINSGGVTRFESNVGSSQALTSLTTDAPGSVEMLDIAIETSGVQTYNDAVVLKGDVTLTSTDNTIVINGGLDGDDLDTPRSLTIDSFDTQNFASAIGSNPVDGEFRLGTLVVHADGVTQDASGLIKANALAIVSTGNVVLDETGNNVNELAAQISSDTDHQHSFTYADVDGLAIATVGVTSGLSDQEIGEATGSNFALSVGGLLTQANGALIELDGDLSIDTTRNTQLADVTFRNTAVGGTELGSSLISGDFTLASAGNVTQTTRAGDDNDDFLQVGGDLTITGGELVEGDSSSNLLGGGLTGGARLDNEIRLSGIVTLEMDGDKLVGIVGDGLGSNRQEITSDNMDSVKVVSMAGGKSLTFGGDGGDVILLGLAANSVKGQLKINTAGSYANTGASLTTGITQSGALTLNDAAFEVQASALNTSPSLGSGQGVINLSNVGNQFSGVIAARAVGMDISITNSDALTLGNVTGKTVILNTNTQTITQTATGTITATELLLQSAGLVTLAGNNRVDTLAANSVAGLDFTNTRELIVGTVGGVDGINSTGDVTLTTDELDVLKAITASDKDLTIQTLTAGRAVSVGALVENTQALDLSDAELSRLTNGFASVTLGRDTAGAVTVESATLDDKLTLISGEGGVDVGGLDVGANDLVINTTGAVTQTAAITAGGLGILNAESVTLTDELNDVVTLAASGIEGDFTFVNADALTLGVVNPTGITAGGDVSISTLDGDLLVNEDVSGGSVLLNAGSSQSAGSASGGDVKIAEETSITATDGTVLVYTGSIDDSTGVTALVGSGSGRFRYNGDEGTTYSGAGEIDSTGVYAIYREQPILKVAPGADSSQYGVSPDLSSVTPTFTGYKNGDDEIDAAITGEALFTTTATSTSNVGTYDIAYDVGLLSAVGYGFEDDASLSNEYSINQRILSLTGTREYNASTTVNAEVLSITAADLVGGQTLTLTGVGSVDDKNVEQNKAVTVGSLALVGDGTEGAGLASNYTLEGGTHTLTITAKQISASGITAQDKAYDGTSAATLQAGGATFEGLIDGDDVDLAANGLFSDKNVAYVNGEVVAKTVVVDTFELIGDDARNYEFAGAVGTITAKITPKTVRLSAVKDYDGSDDLTGKVDIDTGVDGESLTYTGAKASSQNVATANKFVQEITLTDQVGANDESGGLASNYQLPSLSFDATNNQVTINAKTLTATLAAQSKEYDGNTSALVDVGDFDLTGFVVGESASITKTTGLYNDKDVLDANAVTVSLSAGDFAVVDGTDLSNYALPTSVQGDGEITAKALTLTLNGLSKVYDGDVEYDVQAGDYVLEGFVGAERATLSGATALFNSKNVLQANTASLASLNSGHYAEVDGTGMIKTNYSLPTEAVLANGAVFRITPKTVGLSATKVYDGSTDLTGFVTVTTGVGGEELTYSGAQSSSQNVAALGKFISAITLGDDDGATNEAGGLASNYQLPSTLSASNAAVTINPFAVSFTGTRRYNGTTVANASDLTLGALVGSEALGLTGAGTLDDRHVAESKTVTLGGLTLVDGTGLASNYTFTGGTHEMSVTPAPLSVTSADVTKEYDGNTTADGLAIVDAASGTQLFGADTLSGGTFEFTTKHVSRGSDRITVLSDKTVTVSGVTVDDGNGGGNYDVTYVDNTTSTINPATIQVAGLVARDKVYDGTRAANLTAASSVLTGVLSGDDVTATEATGTFDDKNVSYEDGEIVEKDVTADTIYLEGADANNYNMIPVTGLRAKITPLGIRPTVSAESRVYDGTTQATVEANLVLPFEGDDVEIVYDSAAFIDATVGRNKFVSVTGVELVGGDDRGNYVLLADAVSAYADITARPLTIVAEDKARRYGAADPTFTYRQTGLADGDTIDVRFDVQRGPGLSVGNYSITPYGVSNPNYTVDYEDGTLTITSISNSVDFAVGASAPVLPPLSANQIMVNQPLNTPLSAAFSGGQFRVQRMDLGDLQLINISSARPVSLGSVNMTDASERVVDQAVAQIVTSVRQGVSTRVLMVDGGINAED